MAMTTGVLMAGNVAGDNSVVTEPIEIPAEVLKAAKDASAAKEQAMDEQLKAPADVAAPPADAKKTDSGLAYKVLKKGAGETHPDAADTVTVHYTGWTTDGKRFDSSVERGQPASFPLNGVIKGWTEGVQLMVQGEKSRFWIPAEMAYGENPGMGRPGGMLVFDIELLEIKAAEKVPADAEKTASGIAYKILTPGAGDGHPGENDLVTFEMLLKTMTGEVVRDPQGEATTFPVARLPQALQEIFLGMKPGEKRRAWLPEPQAPGGVLAADIDLISYKAAPPAPAVPDDVAAVPKGAQKSDSGLAWKILKEGGADAPKPKATDTVRVHYTGWTTDGKMFDSSVTRGEPATFPLSGVIKGWTEGVQLMKVGEKRRFWIPADLAYGENPGNGAPGGTLVFDVELLEIVN